MHAKKRVYAKHPPVERKTYRSICFFGIVLKYELVLSELGYVFRRKLRIFGFYAVAGRRRYMIDVIRISRRDMHIHLGKSGHPAPEHIRKLGVRRRNEHIVRRKRYVPIVLVAPELFEHYVVGNLVVRVRSAYAAGIGLPSAGLKAVEIDAKQIRIHFIDERRQMPVFVRWRQFMLCDLGFARGRYGRRHKVGVQRIQVLLRKFLQIIGLRILVYGLIEARRRAEIPFMLVPRIYGGKRPGRHRLEILSPYATVFRSVHEIIGGVGHYAADARPHEIVRGDLHDVKDGRRHTANSRNALYVHIPVYAFIGGYKELVPVHLKEGSGVCFVLLHGRREDLKRQPSRRILKRRQTALAGDISRSAVFGRSVYPGSERFRESGIRHGCRYRNLAFPCCVLDQKTV